MSAKLLRSVGSGLSEICPSCAKTFVQADWTWGRPLYGWFAACGAAGFALGSLVILGVGLSREVREVLGPASLGALLLGLLCWFFLATQHGARLVRADSDEGARLMRIRKRSTYGVVAALVLLVLGIVIVDRVAPEPAPATDEYIVAKRDLAPGTVIDLEAIGKAFRPQGSVDRSGVREPQVTEVIGQKLTRPCKAREPLLWSDFAPACALEGPGFLALPSEAPPGKSGSPSDPPSTLDPARRVEIARALLAAADEAVRGDRVWFTEAVPAFHRYRIAEQMLAGLPPPAGMDLAATRRNRDRLEAAIGEMEASLAREFWRRIRTGRTLEAVEMAQDLLFLFEPVPSGIPEIGVLGSPAKGRQYGLRLDRAMVMVHERREADTTEK